MRAKLEMLVTGILIGIFVGVWLAHLYVQDTAWATDLHVVNGQVLP